MNSTLFGVLVGIGLSPALAADVRLPAVISSGMVLQQDAEVPVWGWADPGERVRVTGSWMRQAAEADADPSGLWSVRLRTPSHAKAPQPQTIVVEGHNRVEVGDVLLGEVWFCSGQSNMEMFVGNPGGAFGGVENWEEEVREADLPDVRLFDVPNAVAITPQAGGAGAWSRCTPERAAAYSATAYFFGRMLHRELRIPVGLITSDWGGTPIQAWTSLEGLRSQGGFEEWIGVLEGLHADPGGAAAGHERAIAEWLGKIDAADSGVAGGWHGPGVNLDEWIEADQPAFWDGELAAFDGVVWCRRQVELESEPSGAAVLELGPIDDHDQAWVNGARVGETLGDGSHTAERRYDIPPGVLRKGTNTVVVRVIDTGGPGGMHGAPESIGVRIGSRLHGLSGRWFLRPGPSMRDLPPRPFLPGPHPQLPTMLFNGMVAPVAPLAVKGFLWYQGESNREEAWRYRAMFRGMIADWRKVWGRGDLPFYFVQIAPFSYGGDTGQTAELREAQAMALSVPNTGMAVTMDIGDARDIHPRRKREVGERLALLALARTYGRDVECSGPMYRSMTVSGGKVRVRFDHAKGLNSPGPLEHFRIAGSDRRFVPARARIEGDSVVVWSEQAPSPAAVRFAWGDADAPTLRNAAGLPAAPFRTDQWPGVTEPKPGTVEGAGPP